jgi:hypothetical protein
LECSSYLPVSVCGTVTAHVYRPTRLFLTPGINGFRGHCPSSGAFTMRGVDLPAPRLRRPQPHPSGVPPTLVCPPRARARGSGFLTGFPSPTPFGLGLGADLPCADRLDAGNLRFSARGVLTRVLATYADRVNSIRSTRPCGTASRLMERSPTIAHPVGCGSEASVRGLAPLYCRCRAA